MHLSTAEKWLKRVRSATSNNLATAWPRNYQILHGHPWRPNLEPHWIWCHQLYFHSAFIGVRKNGRKLCLRRLCVEFLWRSTLPGPTNWWASGLSLYPGRTGGLAERVERYITQDAIRHAPAELVVMIIHRVTKLFNLCSWSSETAFISRRFRAICALCLLWDFLADTQKVGYFAPSPISNNWTNFYSALGVRTSLRCRVSEILHVICTFGVTWRVSLVGSALP